MDRQIAWPLSRLALPVPLVALAGLRRRLGLAAAVPRERLADIVALRKLAPFVSADEPLVRAGVDQFSLLCLTLRHGSTPCLNRSGQSVCRVVELGSVPCYACGMDAPRLQFGIRTLLEIT